MSRVGAPRTRQQHSNCPRQFVLRQRVLGWVKIGGLDRGYHGRVSSCISWNLENYTRVQAMFASTVFRRILYHPDESQLLTCGSDRRITYYDSYDGEAIRILEEAADGEMLALDIER